jgi:hypothetical protein
MECGIAAIDEVSISPTSITAFLFLRWFESHCCSRDVASLRCLDGCANHFDIRFHSVRETIDFFVVSWNPFSDSTAV